MEAESSLRHSQEPAISPCPKPEQSSPWLLIAHPACEHTKFVYTVVSKFT